MGSSIDTIIEQSNNIKRIKCCQNKYVHVINKIFMNINIFKCEVLRIIIASNEIDALNDVITSSAIAAILQRRYLQIFLFSVNLR